MKMNTNIKFLLLNVFYLDICQYKKLAENKEFSINENIYKMKKSELGSDKNVR